MELLYKEKKTINEIERKILSYTDYKDFIFNQNSEGLLIFEDNFSAMSKLLNNYKNKIDLIYIDPPFNTKQEFKYNPQRTATISNSAIDTIAYNDNMPFEEYLEFIRERIYLMYQLLSENGTLYIHIDCKIGHYLKIILDEIFSIDNFINEISRIKSNPKNFDRKAFGNQKDIIYIYTKNKGKNIFNNITNPLSETEINRKFPKIDEFGRRYNTVPCHAPGETKNGETGKAWKGIFPPLGRHWRCSPLELEEMDKKGLIEWSKNGVPRIKKYSDEHQGEKLQDIWINYKDPQYPKYPTQKNLEMLEMIVLQSSNENSIIMDCFCGSGTFLLAGLKNNRKVIGIDNSKIAINLSAQCLNEFNIKLY